MARYYETPDIDRERMPSVQGVCKDCGNGTLNNELNPAFELLSSDGLDELELRCMQCGSVHLDIIGG
jgi:uncharacterized Zn finger protein